MMKESQKKPQDYLSGNNKIKVPTELQEQIALFQWASYHPILKDYLFSIPNGGSRHILEAMNLKASGVKSGIPDIFLAYPLRCQDGHIFHGYFGELKRRDKKLSRISINQATYIKRLSGVGYRVDTWWGWEDAKECLLNYLSNKEVT